MIEMELESGSMKIEDDGKVKVSKEIANEINDNSIESDDNKKPNFNVED